MDTPRVMMTPPPVAPQQPKNIHINPHFKGAVVAPVQGVCLGSIPRVDSYPVFPGEVKGVRHTKKQVLGPLGLLP